MLSSEEIVHSKMYANDAFSQWLGIQVLEVRNGECVLEMTITKDMLNGFQIAHGGIAYAFADSALAFASNSVGLQAVSVETSISHHRKVVEGDRLKATTSCIHKSRKLASYVIDVTNQGGSLVASFKGTVYYTGKAW